jgi:transcriptional regulator with XRE-family HTH domain
MKGWKDVMYYELKESGLRIKELRRAAGYTQETFAMQIGISHRTYSGIESGAHSTSIDTLVSIAETLGTTLDYIVCGKEKSQVDEISSLLVALDDEKRDMVLRMVEGMIQSIL